MPINLPRHQPAFFSIQSLTSHPQVCGHQEVIGDPRRSPSPCVLSQHAPHPSLFLTMPWVCLHSSAGIILNSVSSFICIQSPYITSLLLRLPQQSTEPAISQSCPASQEEDLTNLGVKPGPYRWTPGPSGWMPGPSRWMPGQMTGSTQYPAHPFLGTGWRWQPFDSIYFDPVYDVLFGPMMPTIILKKSWYRYALDSARPFNLIFPQIRRYDIVGS